MQLDQALHDGQAEARTLIGILDGLRAAPEGGQHGLDLLLRNARAIVPHREILATILRPANLDDDFCALRREFDGI